MNHSWLALTFWGLILALTSPVYAGCAGALGDGSSVAGVWNSTRNQKFVNLLIDQGLDFHAGDRVVIRGDRDQRVSIEAIASELRRREAADVVVLYRPNHEDVRLALANGESPEVMAARLLPESMVRQLCERRYASLNVGGSNDPGEPLGFDAGTWTAYDTSYSRRLRPFFELIISDQISWSLVELPTARQANLVHPTERADRAWEYLTEQVATVFRLDEPDPSRWWAMALGRIETRAGALNALRIKSLRYEAPGTDLTVELHANARWKGGHHRRNGRVTQANFPTFENFVSPMYRSARGFIRITRPVPVSNILVRDAWFRFENGRVVEYGAKAGVHALDRFFAEDARHAYLGEVALVDGDSPVALHPLFYSIVFDENASCHVALGSAYPHTWSKPYPQGASELEAAQLNVAVDHIDFMIGDPSLNVTAETFDGRLVPIMRMSKLVVDRDE